MHALGALLLVALVAAACAHTPQSDEFTQCTPLGRCFQVCDSAASCLDIPSLDESHDDVIVLSTNAGVKMRVAPFTFSDVQPSNWSTSLRISINQTQHYQTVLGFGGAFTDAAMISLATLPAALQDNVLGAYFGANGARYSVGRVPIGGCDFSTHSYAYVQEGDYELATFQLAPEDTQPGGKIDVIRRAQVAAVHNVRLFGSAWTAPPFLKVNASTSNPFVGGTLDPQPRAQDTWARYLSRFVAEYAKHSVQLWAVTMGNEPTPLPSFLAQTWDTMFYRCVECRLIRAAVRRLILTSLFTGPCTVPSSRSSLCATT